MLIRLVFLGLVVAALVYLYRRLRAPALPQESSPEDFSDTVSCAHCGLTIPKAEACYRHQQYYCCEEHSQMR